MQRLLPCPMAARKGAERLVRLAGGERDRNRQRLVRVHVKRLTAAPADIGASHRQSNNARLSVSVSGWMMTAEPKGSPRVGTTTTGHMLTIPSTPWDRATVPPSTGGADS